MDIRYFDLARINDSFRPEIDEAVNNVITSGWYLNGDETKKFEKEFAELCKWDNYQPNSIPLDDFIEKLLPKLEKDNVMLAVFPLSKGKGIIRTVQEIIADIERECEQYE